MTREAQSSIRGTRWTVRLIPFFLAAAFGAATYIVPAHLCVGYLYQQRRERGTAIALLVLYFLFFLLTVVSYFRLFIAIQSGAGLVPLERYRGSQPERNMDKKRARRGRDIEGDPYVPPDSNPDSPGLEAAYSQRVFVCQEDGRPKWCSACCQWKPDRASHSNDLQRCVRKMDHLCPWVGGMISEASFNFFLHFTTYCTFYLIVCLSTSAYCLSKQRQDGEPLDARPVVIIALSGFFGIFTSGMSGTSLGFVLTNTTNIDLLKKMNDLYLAIRVPRHSPTTSTYRTITYPLPQSRSSTEADGSAGSPRDDQAVSTFAIVKAEGGENPWDLGMWENFKEVMGHNVLEWLLPIRHSPCCYHNGVSGAYRLGPLIGELRKRYSLPDDLGKVDDGQS